MQRRQKLKILYDGNDVSSASSISFGNLDEGIEHKIILSMQNVIKYPLSVSIEKPTDTDVSFDQTSMTIQPNEIKNLIISITPSIDRMEPISVPLNMKLTYVVK